MDEFLSAAWISALDALVRDVPELAAVADAPLVIEQQVHTASGSVVYHLMLGPEVARVIAGPSSSPDLTLFTTEAAARRIHAGTANAQACLAEGTMRLRGNPEVLTAHAAALARVGDLVRSRRARPGSSTASPSVDPTMTGDAAVRATPLPRPLGG